MGEYRVKIEPVAEPMTAEEVRTMHLYTLAFEDTYLTSLIEGVRQYIEAAYDMAVVPQTIEETFPTWPGRCINLSMYPVTAITSVKYLDANEDEQTVSDTDYYGFPGKLKGMVQFKKNYSFPGLSESPEAVKIEYTAGAATVPEYFKIAIRLMVARLHLKREDDVEETIAKVLTKAEKLLFPNRAITV